MYEHPSRQIDTRSCVVICTALQEDVLML